MIKILKSHRDLLRIRDNRTFNRGSQPLKVINITTIIQISECNNIINFSHVNITIYIFETADDLLLLQNSILVGVQSGKHPLLIFHLFIIDELIHHQGQNSLLQLQVCIEVSIVVHYAELEISAQGLHLPVSLFLYPWVLECILGGKPVFWILLEQFVNQSYCLL